MGGVDAAVNGVRSPFRFDSARPPVGLGFVLDRLIASVSGSNGRSRLVEAIEKEKKKNPCQCLFFFFFF
jgi:hypothetical protein